MPGRVTIKDIATEAGVSTGTVHRAIYGKKGVTDQVRNRILELCAQRGYRTNDAASALKRGKVRIVAVFPGLDTSNRYFYANVWHGFRRRIKELSAYDIETIEVPYYSDGLIDQKAALSSVYTRHMGEIDGLITIGHFTPECKSIIQKFAENNVPVFLACDDTSDSGRIACVQANYDVTGRIAAELLEGQLPAGGEILLLAGDLLIPSHYLTVDGFDAYITEKRPDITLIKLNGYSNETELLANIKEMLDKRPGINGAFSVSARLSVVLAQEIAARSLQNRVRVVASDLFEENIRHLEQGIVKNIIFKDPEQQSYLATKMMTDYLLKAEKPVSEVAYVESRVIFKSSLSFYSQFL